MAAPPRMYGRKHQKGMNVVTTLAMVGFHAGAIAALFFIDGGSMLSALTLYCVAGMLGITIPTFVTAPLLTLVFGIYGVTLFGHDLSLPVGGWGAVAEET